MKRNKITSCVCGAIAVLILLTTSGCSNIVEGTKSLTTEINNAVSFPEEYFITYEVEHGDGTVSTVAKGVDAEGIIYYRSGNLEVLYVPAEALYDRYERDESGVFTKSSYGISYTASRVEQETKEFTDYADKSLDRYLPTVKENGEDDFLSRTCDSCEITVGIESFNKTYTFLVDKETGICLSWEESNTLYGNVNTDEVAFRCLEFQTDNIELPQPN